ncbi:hypothetical protein RUND412_000607 [Rhizina undulata]
MSISTPGASFQVNTPVAITSNFPAKSIVTEAAKANDKKKSPKFEDDKENSRPGAGEVVNEGVEDSLISFEEFSFRVGGKVNCPKEGLERAFNSANRREVDTVLALVIKFIAFLDWLWHQRVGKSTALLVSKFCAQKNSLFQLLPGIRINPSGVAV